jgi:LPXTG-motif cell wall-anchored protein
MKNFPSLLSAVAGASLLLSGAALAGMPNTAGTLLSDEAKSSNEIAIVVGLAVAVVGVIVYVRRRKSK